MATTAPFLITLAGLPGTGKTSLSRQLARELRAAYVRIDTIEQAIIESGVSQNDIGPTGYFVGYGIAEDNLKQSVSVVADSVNPLLITRQAWRDVAARSGATIIEIEIICSDKTQHRQRLEARVADIANHKQPTWQEVVSREYDAWDKPPIVIDTAGRSLEQSMDELREALQSIVSFDAKGK